MVCSRLIIKFSSISCPILFLLCIGCGTADKKEDVPPALSEAPAPNPSSYQNIVEMGKKIHLHYRDLPEEVEEFLCSDKPETPERQKEYMTVAVIGAGVYHWDGNVTKAMELAQRAYACAPNHMIEFLTEWQIANWSEEQDSKILVKLVQMKDFIISCSNLGSADFELGNNAFIDNGQFAQATQFYNQALRKGIGNNELRKACYMRLAGGLFKMGDEAQAKSVFLERWILDTDVQFQFGDAAMRDFFQETAEYFRAKFSDFPTETK